LTQDQHLFTTKKTTQRLRDEAFRRKTTVELTEDDWTGVVRALFRGTDAKHLLILLKRLALEESEGRNASQRVPNGSSVPSSVLTAAEAMGFREKSYDYLMHARPGTGGTGANGKLTLTPFLILILILVLMLTRTLTLPESTYKCDLQIVRDRLRAWIPHRRSSFPLRSLLGA